MPVVAGHAERGSEPVYQPSDHLGGSEKVAFQFYQGTRGGCPLAWGPPVDEFGFGSEKDTPMSRPLVAMVEKRPCRRRTLPLYEGEATVIEMSSTYETMRPLGTDMCRGAT